MYKILVLTLLGVIGISVAQILQDGQCDPNISLSQDFDFEQVRLLCCNLKACSIFISIPLMLFVKKTKPTNTLLTKIYPPV